MTWDPHLHSFNGLGGRSSSDQRASGVIYHFLLFEQFSASIDDSFSQRDLCSKVVHQLINGPSTMITENAGPLIRFFIINYF